MKHIKSINEFNEYSEEELIGKKISLTKKLINVHSNREPELVEGILSRIDDKIKYTPLFIISDENGKTLCNLMYDQYKNEFVEGHTSWHIVFTPNDEESTNLLNSFKEIHIENNK
jgi:hypothetical protein